MSSSKQPKPSQPRRINVPWEIKAKNLFLIHGEIKAKNLFLIHRGEHVPDLQPGGDLLAECTAAGRLGGNFRWAMKGGSANAGFRLKHLCDFGNNTPAYYLSLDMKPDEIELRPNTCSSKWSDLMDWIAEDKLTVTCDDEGTREDLLGKQILVIFNPIFLKAYQLVLQISVSPNLYVSFITTLLQLYYVTSFMNFI